MAAAMESASVRALVQRDRVAPTITLGTMHECELADWPLRGCGPWRVGPASLQLYAQSVRYPIDVVEVGDDLIQVDDIAIRQPDRTQRNEV